jgi:hypothetical protein
VRIRQASIKQAAKRYNGMRNDPLGSLSRASSENGASKAAETVDNESAAKIVVGASRF